MTIEDRIAKAQKQLNNKGYEFNNSVEGLIAQKSICIAAIKELSRKGLVGWVTTGSIYVAQSQKGLEDMLKDERKGIDNNNMIWLPQEEWESITVTVSSQSQYDACMSLIEELEEKLDIVFCLWETDGGKKYRRKPQICLDFDWLCCMEKSSSF